VATVRRLDAELCLDRLAARLRHWRSDAGLTLQQLAERSGVAASTIHKVELRKTVPTVAVLFKIAQGLDRPVTEFLDEEPEPAAHVHRRSDALVEVERGVRVAALGNPDRDARGWRVQLATGPEPTTLRVEGDVLVLCEEGALELARQDARWQLARGDVLSLRAPIPFRLEAACRETCRFLLLGQVPASPRALLDREPARARPQAPVAQAKA
jgi:transcriptional regulator with XRE-family HTH domain